MKNLILLALIATATVHAPGCGQLKEEARATAKSVIDCTKAEAAEAIKTYAPTLEAVLLDSAGDDGQLDWDKVKSATKGYATDAAGCVVASTISRLLNPPPRDPNAPQSEGLRIDPVALSEGWEALRRDQFGGSRYQLESGTL